MLFHRCIFRSYIRVYIRIASQGSISGHFPARYRHAQPPTHNWHIHFRIRLDTGTGEMQNASCLEKLSRPPWKFIRPPIDGRSSSIEAIQFIPFITLRSFFRFRSFPFSFDPSVYNAQHFGLTIDPRSVEQRRDGNFRGTMWVERVAAEQSIRSESVTIIERGKIS